MNTENKTDVAEMSKMFNMIHEMEIVANKQAEELAILKERVGELGTAVLGRLNDMQAQVNKQADDITSLMNGNDADGNPFDPGYGRGFPQSQFIPRMPSDPFDKFKSIKLFTPVDIMAFVDTLVESYSAHINNNTDFTVDDVATKLKNVNPNAATHFESLYIREHLNRLVGRGILIVGQILSGGVYRLASSFSNQVCDGGLTQSQFNSHMREGVFNQQFGTPFSIPPQLHGGRYQNSLNYVGITNANMVGKMIDEVLTGLARTKTVHFKELDVRQALLQFVNPSIADLPLIFNRHLINLAMSGNIIMTNNPELYISFTPNSKFFIIEGTPNAQGDSPKAAG